MSPIEEQIQLTEIDMRDESTITIPAHTSIRIPKVELTQSLLEEIFPRGTPVITLLPKEKWHFGAPSNSVSVGSCGKVEDAYLNYYKESPAIIVKIKTNTYTFLPEELAIDKDTIINVSKVLGDKVLTSLDVLALETRDYKVEIKEQLSLLEHNLQEKQNEHTKVNVFLDGIEKLRTVWSKKDNFYYSISSLKDYFKKVVICGDIIKIDLPPFSWNYLNFQKFIEFPSLRISLSIYAFCQSVGTHTISPNLLTVSSQGKVINGFIHPHVSQAGIPCYGTYMTALIEAIHKCSIPEVVRCVNNLLRSHNPESVYVKSIFWSNYPEVVCTKCDKIVRDYAKRSPAFFKRYGSVSENNLCPCYKSEAVEHYLRRQAHPDQFCPTCSEPKEECSCIRCSQKTHIIPFPGSSCFSCSFFKVGSPLGMVSCTDPEASYIKERIGGDNEITSR